MASREAIYIEDTLLPLLRAKEARAKELLESTPDGSARAKSRGIRHANALARVSIFESRLAHLKEGHD